MPIPMYYQLIDDKRKWQCKVDSRYVNTEHCVLSNTAAKRKAANDNIIIWHLAYVYFPEIFVFHLYEISEDRPK